MRLNSHHSNFFLLSFTIASALMLGLVSTEAVHARQSKVDVCHIDEYGAYYHLNIAEAAFQAHIGHVDSIPGDLVPGSDDQLSFADDCTLIPACPCVVDLPSGWQATEAISGIALEECADGTFVESVVAQFPGITRIKRTVKAISPFGKFDPSPAAYFRNGLVNGAEVHIVWIARIDDQ